MNTVENICPVCKENNELEATFCVNCGTSLEAPGLETGGRTKRTNIPAELLEGVKDWSVDEAAVPENGVAIYIEGEFTPILKDSSDEIVIGRKSGKTEKPSESLLDLSPMGAYGHGVSRRHAVILRTEDGYEFIDLGSSNGTWLNNERLMPHKHYPLSSGSHLRLGKMRLFMLYQIKK